MKRIWLWSAGALMLLMLSLPSVAQVSERSGPVSDISGDLELEERVRNELVWNAHVNATDIFVDADGGVIILTGTVPSTTAWEAAEVVARRSGAAAVVNRLRVVP